MVDERFGFRGVQVPESGSRFQQRGHAHASLNHGVVHFTRQASPFGQQQRVPGASLARIQGKPAPYRDSQRQGQQPIQPVCLVEKGTQV